MTSGSPWCSINVMIVGKKKYHATNDEFILLSNYFYRINLFLKYYIQLSMLNYNNFYFKFFWSFAEFFHGQFCMHSTAIHKLKTSIIFNNMAATTTVASNISRSACNWTCLSFNSSLIFLFSSMFLKMISSWFSVMLSSSIILLRSWSSLYSVDIWK